ncbi:hypothetical protein DFS33DRAFT_757205 [Desarmillaria ectypa]|nr:hypothetical protein DFS33DRAFT_757205 [Desarmillaria ectypa]
MTRTARATFPKAVLKDRSESKSGFDKSLRKNGGGQHNWGRLADERELEYAAMDDEALELQEEFEEAAEDTASVSAASDSSNETKAVPARAFSISEKEIETAKQFRKKALKGEVDLAAIARTSSAVSSSPPTSKTVQVVV